MEKWQKSRKIEPVYPATTFHKIYIHISLCMVYPAGELLVFKIYAIHQQFWEHLKVQKIMDQHNFEMIHFKCSIPAIGCTIPVLLCYADSWFNFGI